MEGRLQAVDTPAGYTYNVHNHDIKIYYLHIMCMYMYMYTIGTSLFSTVCT